jgi:hypothetical protein
LKRRQPCATAAGAATILLRKAERFKTLGLITYRNHARLGSVLPFPPLTPSPANINNRPLLPPPLPTPRLRSHRLDSLHTPPRLPPRSPTPTAKILHPLPRLLPIGIELPDTPLLRPTRMDQRPAREVAQPADRKRRVRGDRPWC